MGALKRYCLFFLIMVLGGIIITIMGGMPPIADFVIFEILVGIIWFQYLNMETSKVDAELFRTQYFLLRAALDDYDEDDDEEDDEDDDEEDYVRGLA